MDEGTGVTALRQLIEAILGRPATGAHVTTSDINTYRIENGKIAET